MDKFEEWFASQNFYTNMLFIHGDGFFVKDGDVYRVLPVQMTWEAWQSRQSEVDEYKMVSESIEDLYLLERKKVKAVEQVLIDLKESMTNFKEMDLYDKGVRVVTDYIIRDLEKALRGEHEA